VSHSERSSKLQITASIARSPRHLFLGKLIKAAYDRKQENRRRLSELEARLNEKGESVLRGPVFECLEDIDWLLQGLGIAKNGEVIRNSDGPRDPKEVTEALEEPVKALRSQLRALSRAIKILEPTQVRLPAIAALKAELRYVQQTLSLYRGRRSIFHNIGLRTLSEPIPLEVFYKEGKKDLDARIGARIKILLAACMHGLRQRRFTKYQLYTRIIPELVEIFYPQYRHLCRITPRRSTTGGDNTYRTSPVLEIYRNRFERASV